MDPDDDKAERERIKALGECNMTPEQREKGFSKMIEAVLKIWRFVYAYHLEEDTIT